MFKTIVIFCLLITLNASAQNSVTKSYSGLGINPTSGYKTITETGKILTGSSRGIKQKADTSTKKQAVEKIATVNVKPIFLLADSVLELQKIVIPNPTKCGGYGLQTITYFKNSKSLLLFCTPNFSAYENLPQQIKKSKTKAVKQKLTTKLNNAKKLVGMYQKLTQLINNAN